MTLAQQIGKRLRTARGSKTQVELSNSTGLQSAAISHFEDGRRAPSAKNIVRLCRALKVSADYLLGLKTNA